MNCDQVFDLLTRPQPVGPHNGLGMDVHLTQCTSCRELAAAMQPAISAFQVLADCDSRIRRRNVAAKAHPAQADTFRLAAALLVGLTLGFAWNSQNGRVQSADIPLAVWQERSQWLSDDVVQPLRLSQACLMPSFQQVITTAEVRSHENSTRIACCMLCHGPSRSGSSFPASATEVVASCQLCHLN